MITGHNSPDDNLIRVVHVIGWGNITVLGYLITSGLATIAFQEFNYPVFGNIIVAQDDSAVSVRCSLGCVNRKLEDAFQVILVLDQFAVAFGAESVLHSKLSRKSGRGHGFGPAGGQNRFMDIAPVLGFVSDEHVAGVKQIL